MAYWKLRIADEFSVVHRKQIEIEDGEDFKAILTAQLFRHADLMPAESIIYDYSEEKGFSIQAFDNSGDLQSELHAQEINHDQTERSLRLKEIISKKNSSALDIFNILISEGYKIEEIAIAALEEK